MERQRRPLSKAKPKPKPTSNGTRKTNMNGTRAAPQSEENGGPPIPPTLKAGVKTTNSFFERMSKNDTFATRDASAKAKERRNAVVAKSKLKLPKLPLQDKQKPAVIVTTTRRLKSAPTSNGNGNRPTSRARSKGSAAKSRVSTPKSRVSTPKSRASTARSKTTLNSRKSASSKKSNTLSKGENKSRTPVIRTKSTSSISTKSSVKSTVKNVEKVEKVEKVEQVEKEKEQEKMLPEVAIKKRLTQGRRQSTKLIASLLGLGDMNFDDLLNSDDDLSVDEANDHSEEEEDDLDPKFVSCYTPLEMRSLALVAHNHMKAPMKKFVLANQNLLKKFRLTGTNTTMTMLKEVFGDDPTVVYGKSCSSGPLGGDAELVQVMCMGELGGCIFFQDPMSSHPHNADIVCLTRQANVHNIMIMPNPTSAYACMTTLRVALEKGKAELIPSFFHTLVSPSVEEYKKDQARVLAENMEHHDDEHSGDEHHEDDDSHS